MTSDELTLAIKSTFDMLSTPLVDPQDASSLRRHFNRLLDVQAARSASLIAPTKRLGDINYGEFTTAWQESPR